jgi:hypothetical protein
MTDGQINTGAWVLDEQRELYVVDYAGEILKIVLPSP